MVRAAGSPPRALAALSALGLLLLGLLGTLSGRQAHAKKATPWKEGAVKSDVKYVRCSVCELAARELHRQVKALREEAAGSRGKLAEADILDLTDKVCDPERSEGEWIAKLDMVEQADGSMALVEHDDFGECMAECRTMQRACEKTLEDAAVDIAEVLYRGEAGRAAISQALCRELSGACHKKAPKLPKERPSGGDNFVVADPEERRVAKMLKEMQGVEGMPGMSMYSREELMERYSIGGEEGEEFGGQYDPYGASGLPYDDPYGMSGGEADAGMDLLGSVSDVAGKVGNAVNWAAEGVRGLFGGIGGGGEGGELRRALR